MRVVVLFLLSISVGTPAISSKVDGTSKVIESSHCAPLSERKYKPDDRILIVGAGVSGLAIARSLIHQNVSPEKITVVEMKKIAGGQVMSIKDPSRESDRFFELGAQVLLPGYYNRIYQLIDDHNSRLPEETRLVTTPTMRGGHFDINSKTVSSGLSIADYGKIATQANRYIKRFESEWKSILELNGFSHIPEELKKPWHVFIKDNNFETLSKALIPLIGGSGFAMRNTNPTTAARIVRYLKPDLIRRLIFKGERTHIFEGNGYQRLWRLEAEYLKQIGVNFEYNTELKQLDRGCDQKPIKSILQSKSDKKSRELLSEHVFFTPGLDLLKWLTKLTENEQNALDQIVYNEYHSILVSTNYFQNVDEIQDKKSSFGITPNIFGDPLSPGNDLYGFPILMVKPHADINNKFIVYVHGDGQFSDDQIDQNIITTFGPSTKILHHQRWSRYFPHVQDDLEAVYQEITNFQGAGGLWMVGEFFSFTSSHEVYNFAYDFAENFTKGN